MNKEKINDIICESSSDYDILNDAYNYIESLEQQCKKQKEVIDKLEKKIKVVKQYDFDKVGRYELLSYKKYKDNWNKLKEYIVNEYFMFMPLNATTKSIMILLEKMQELEQGSDNDE